MVTGLAGVLRLMARWGITRRVALEVNHLQFVYGDQVVVTSGYRSPARNRRVGGSPTSWHLKGRAVDLVGPSWVLARCADHAHRTGAVEVLRESDHLHVAW